MLLGDCAARILATSFYSVVLGLWDFSFFLLGGFDIFFSCKKKYLLAPGTCNFFRHRHELRCVVLNEALERKRLPTNWLPPTQRQPQLDLDILDLLLYC
jgi:hypothetical protein